MMDIDKLELEERVQRGAKRLVVSVSAVRDELTRIWVRVIKERLDQGVDL